MKSAAWMIALGALILTLGLSACQNGPASQPPGSGDWENVTISIHSPALDAVYNVATPTLSYTATAGAADEAIPLEFLRAAVQDGAGGAVHALNAPASGDPLPPLGDGAHVLTFTVLSPDNAPQVTVNVPFGTDVTPPEVSLLSPVADTADPAPVLRYSTSESGTVTVLVNGEAVPTRNGERLYPLDDGLNSVRVLVEDAAGNTGEASASFLVDGTAPVVSLLSPVGGVLSALPELSFSSDEAGHAVVSLNGGVVAETDVTAGEPAYLGLADVLPGDNTLRVTVTDALGNEGAAESAFAFDPEAPLVTLELPDTLFTTLSVPLTFSVDDASGSVNFTVKLEALDDAGNVLAGWLISPTETLVVPGDGTYRLWLTATDAGGNTASVSRIFRVDTTAPEVAITSPADGSLTGQALPVLGVESSEASLYRVRVYVWAGGPRAYDASDLTTVQPGEPLRLPDSSALGDGLYTVAVEIEDEAGWVGSDMATFTVDAVGPVVAFLSPQLGDAFARQTLSVRYSVHDAQSVRLQVSDQDGNLWYDQSRPIDPIQPVPRTYQDTLQFPNGVHTLTLIGSAAGHADTSTSVTVAVNAVQPAVSLLTPTVGDVVGTVLPVSFMAYNADRAEVSVDGVVQAEPAVAAGPTGQRIDLSLDAGAEGPHEVRVVVGNENGEATAAASFIADHTAPVVVLHAPADDSLYSGAVTLLYDVAEANGATTQQARLTHPDGTVDTFAVESGRSLALTDGVYGIEVIATDTAGNTGSAAASFTVDPTAPLLAVSAPSGLYASRTVPVAYTAEDALGGVPSLSATLETLDAGGAVVSSAPVVLADALTVPDDGAYRLWVRAVDAAGNATEAATSFRVDTTAPVVSILQPADGSTVTDATPTLRTEASEPGRVRVYVFPGGPASFDAAMLTAVQPGQPLHYADGSPLADGLNTVAVEVEDDAGWMGSATASFTVDAAGPEATFIFPTDGSAFSRHNLSVRYNVHDAATVRLVAADASGAVWFDQTRPIDPVQPIPRTYEDTLRFPDGVHTLTLTASAPGYADVSEQVRVTVNAADVGVDIVSPEEGAVFVGDVPLRFMAYNATNAEVRVDGVLWHSQALAGDPDGETVDLALSGFAHDGGHRVSVRVTGPDGSDSDAVRFGIDTTAPEVTLYSPREGEDYDGAVTLLYGLGWLKGKDTASATAVLTHPDGTTETLDVHNGQRLVLPPGDYTLQVLATDVAGNEGASATVGFTMEGDHHDDGWDDDGWDDGSHHDRGDRNASCLFGTSPGRDRGRCLKDLGGWTHRH